MSEPFKMFPHPGPWVTGQTVGSGRVVTGRAMRSANPMDGRDVVIVSDESGPSLTPVYVFADTIVQHGFTQPTEG